MKTIGSVSLLRPMTMILKTTTFVAFQAHLLLKYTAELLRNIGFITLGSKVCAIDHLTEEQDYRL